MTKICQMAITTAFAGTVLAHSAPDAGESSSTNYGRVPQMKRDLPTRKQNIEALTQKEYDVLVIGGGAVGAGCALDAATRGLKTALVEANDFGSGTSSRSTKLLHGGFRDFSNGISNMNFSTIRRVRRSLAERSILEQMAPHLSKPLSIMIPVHYWWQLPGYWLKLSLYNILAPDSSRRPFFIGYDEAVKTFPIIKRNDLKGAFIFHENQHDDARMCLAVILTASRYGADVCNYMKVIDLIKKDDEIVGARVKDQLTNKKYNVSAKVIINATGAKVDEIRQLNDSDAQPLCAPSMGTHVVLPGYYCPKDVAVFDPKSRDGRLIYFVPWQGHTIVGTTDVTPKETGHTAYPTESEVAFLLDGVINHVNPKFEVRRCDILSAWSGLRPLPQYPDQLDKTLPEINHVIHFSNKNLITVVGGSWTSFRLMAEHAVNAAINLFELEPQRRHSVTAHCKLDGAAGWSPYMYIRLVQDFGIERDVALHLSQTYGTNAFKVVTKAALTGKAWPIVGKKLHSEFPYIEAEVRHGVREYACTLEDMIARRMRVAFLNVQVTEDLLPQVANLMADELGWSYDMKRKQISQARTFLNTQMGRITMDVSKATIPIKMSVKQVQMYAAYFKNLDAQNAGYVSINKCCKAIQNLGVKEVPVELMHDVLRDIDVHAQGRVNLYEFLLLMSAVVHGDTAYLRYAKMHLDQKLAMINERKRNVIPPERTGGGL